ncbi:MAG: phytoene desaturase family protein [Chloroflexota bacterium]
MKYDAVVVGAGVGGLTVASLLAHAGWQVLLVEQSDRVGGRAKTLTGDELLARGERWYRDVLGQQYCWLANAEPSFETIQREGLLAGYQIDLGYHGVSLNGRGYFYDLDQIIGSGELAGVEFAGNINATYIGDEWYLDFHAGKLDPRLADIVQRSGLPFLDFYLSSFKMSADDFARFESVSLERWCRERGIDRQPALYEMLHAVGTLITTINDPAEISVGDIFRYFAQVINPRFKRGIARWPSGFVVGGVQQWLDSVVGRFRHFGGELWLNSRVLHIRIAEGRVWGVTVETADGELVEIDAPVVVSNVPTQETFRYADPAAFPPEYVERSRNLRSYGSIAPYFGLKELALPEAQWSLGIKDTIVIPKGDRLSHDVYMCWNIQSQSDPRCAPAGKHLLTAYAPVTEDEARDKELMAWACGQIVEYLERRYPGFRDSIEWALFPVSWRLEGVAKDVQQAGTLKTPVRALSVAGLFFAGDTVRGYGVAMDCACAAGLICASEITGEDYGVH